MGQAKLRKEKNANQDAIPAEVLQRISIALRKLTQSASEKYGQDCTLHARFAQALLSELGYQTTFETGFAAWRVGNGDSDVILHAPLGDMPDQPGALPFHAWLQSGENILDFTTYQLKDKAAQLDAMDGGKTTVDWFPDYIYKNIRESRTLKDVIQLETGMYFYQKNADVAALVKAKGGEIDPADYEAFRIIFNHPDVQVHGPSGNSVEGHAQTNKLKPQ